MCHNLVCRRKNPSTLFGDFLYVKAKHNLCACIRRVISRRTKQVSKLRTQAGK